MDIIAKRIAGTCMTVLLVLSGLSCLTNLTERKSGEIKNGPFFEETKDYDVLYMGTSHVTTNA